MKVLVAGSRSIGQIGDRQWDYEALEALLDRAIQASGLKPTEIISGGAPGPDRAAARWAQSRGIPLTEIKPDWSKGRGAGLTANAALVQASDALIALHDGKSKGTTDTIKKMRRKGGPVHIEIINWSPDPETSSEGDAPPEPPVPSPEAPADSLPGVDQGAKASREDQVGRVLDLAKATVRVARETMTNVPPQGRQPARQPSHFIAQLTSSGGPEPGGELDHLEAVTRNPPGNVAWFATAKPLLNFNRAGNSVCVLFHHAPNGMIDALIARVGRDRQQAGREISEEERALYLPWKNELNNWWWLGGRWSDGTSGIVRVQFNSLAEVPGWSDTGGLPAAEAFAGRVTIAGWDFGEGFDTKGWMKSLTR